jgi:hypothetical protein
VKHLVQEFPGIKLARENGLDFLRGFFNFFQVQVIELDSGFQLETVFEDGFN